MEIGSFDITQFRCSVGIKVTVAAANLAKWNVNVGVKTSAIPLALQEIVGGPGKAEGQWASQLLLLLALVLIRRERRDECLLRYFYPAHHLHALFTLFLLL